MSTAHAITTGRTSLTPLMDMTPSEIEAYLSLDLIDNSLASAEQKLSARDFARITRHGSVDVAPDKYKAARYEAIATEQDPTPIQSKTSHFYNFAAWYSAINRLINQIMTVGKISVHPTLSTVLSVGGFFCGAYLLFDLLVICKSILFPNPTDEPVSAWVRCKRSFLKDGRNNRIVSNAIGLAAGITGLFIAAMSSSILSLAIGGFFIGYSVYQLGYILQPHKTLLKKVEKEIHNLNNKIAAISEVSDEDRKELEKLKYIKTKLENKIAEVKRNAIFGIALSLCVLAGVALLTFCPPAGLALLGTIGAGIVLGADSLLGGFGQKIFGLFATKKPQLKKTLSEPDLNKTSDKTILKRLSSESAIINSNRHGIAIPTVSEEPCVKQCEINDSGLKLLSGPISFWSCEGQSSKSTQREQIRANSVYRP